MLNLIMAISGLQSFVAMLTITYLTYNYVWFGVVVIPPERIEWISALFMSSVVIFGFSLMVKHT